MRVVMPQRLKRPKQKTSRNAIIYLLFLAICLENGARVILSSKMIERLARISRQGSGSSGVWPDRDATGERIAQWGSVVLNCPGSGLRGVD